MPSQVPTTVPTDLPTAYPTTASPTRVPTRYPTTRMPTDMPTQVPTQVPTDLPTAYPATALPTATMTHIAPIMPSVPPPPAGGEDSHGRNAQSAVSNMFDLYDSTCAFAVFTSGLQEVNQACCVKQSDCGGKQLPTSCTPRCGKVYLPFYRACNRTINIMFDMHATHAVSDNRAPAFDSLAVDCSENSPAGLQAKIASMQKRGCTIDVSHIVAMRPSTKCKDDEATVLQLTGGRTCAQAAVEKDFCKLMRTSALGNLCSCTCPAESSPGVAQTRHPTATPTTAAPTTASPTTAEPTPPPTKAPTASWADACHVHPGHEIQSGTAKMAHISGTASSSEQDCNRQCVAQASCTAWVRAPSMGACWMFTQANPQFAPANDRNGASRCEAGGAATAGPAKGTPHIQLIVLA